VRSFLAILAVAASLAACGASGSGAEATIRGVVLVGPMCPVEVEGSPCPDQPYAGVDVTAFVEGDMGVASDRTDAEGRFELTVRGGTTYRVTVIVQAPQVPTARRVTLDEGEDAQVTLHVDSGIR
jgi:hypothetical protein